MHQVKFRSEHSEGENVFRGRINTSSSRVEGLENTLLDLSHEENPATEFVIVYNASCPKKEEHIKTLLSEINSRKKNELFSRKFKHSLMNFKEKKEKFYNRFGLKIDNDAEKNISLFKNRILNRLGTKKRARPIRCDKPNNLHYFLCWH